MRGPWTTQILLLVVLLLRPALALASPAPAPRPGDADGIEVEARKGAKVLLWIPRVILFVPYHALNIAAYPVRVSLDVYHRYALRDLFYDLFFNDARTFGIYPVARLESGFGVNGGARMVYKDLLGRGGRLSAQANFGRRFGRNVGLQLDTGDAMPRGLVLGLGGQYRMVPRDIFAGLGNAPASTAAAIDEPVDPFARDVAVITRFRHEYARGAVSLTAPLGDELFSMRLAHLWTWRRFERSKRTDPADDIVDLERVYDTRQLVGYDDGLINGYTELRLDYDTRASPPRVSTAAPASGWWLQIWAGYAEGVARDPSRYGRFGCDAQRFIDLWGGDRVLRLRALIEGLAGRAERIPFVDLPALGGPYFGRGHLRDRFRDRVAMMGTVEYLYPVNFRVNAYLFVEPGLVARYLGDFEVHRIHMGYGGGLQVQTMRTFLARVLIASSLEGGLFLNLNLSPADRERKSY